MNLNDFNSLVDLFFHQAEKQNPASIFLEWLNPKNKKKLTRGETSSNFYNKPSKNLKLIGITGTNGKTTTTQLIDFILRDNKYNSSSLGTLGFSSPSGIISTGITTPESIELQQILRT